MAMIRKQFHVTEAQNNKLRQLAAFRGCNEADVIRDAIDRLPDHSTLNRLPRDPGERSTERYVPQQASGKAQEEARQVLECLRTAGLMGRSAFETDGDLAEGEELEALEREVYEWLDSLPEPLGLSEAVIEERQHR